MATNQLDPSLDLINERMRQLVGLRVEMATMNDAAIMLVGVREDGAHVTLRISSRDGMTIDVRDKGSR
jgi:hypothetical protein